MNASASAPSTSVTRHPLLWISAGVLVAHALVLQAMPLNAPDSAKAAALVFQTRTINPPAPPPAPAAALPAPTAPPSVAAAPLRLGPAKRAIAQPHRPASTEAQAPSNSADAPVLHTSLRSEPAPADSPSPDTTAATAQAIPVAAEEAEETATDDSTAAAPEMLAALSGQHILVAGANTTPRQRGSKATSPAPVHIPAPQRLAFDVTGQAKKFQYRAQAELLWQHDGQQYQAQQEIKVLLLGSRQQSSQGKLTAQGLQPLQFTDRSRREQTAQFDHAAGMVRFTHPEAAPQPLLPGMQDRLSVFIQLGALLAAAPERYPHGTQIHISTVGGRNAQRWSFRIEGPETLQLPNGPLNTLKLQRLADDAQDPEQEQQAQLWLAPTLGYLPARIRLTQAQGDFVDLQLRNHSAP